MTFLACCMLVQSLGVLATSVALVRLLRLHAADLSALRKTLKNYDALRTSGGRADTLLLRAYRDSDGTTGKILILALTGSVSLNIPVRDIDMEAFVARLQADWPPDPHWSYAPP